MAAVKTGDTQPITQVTIREVILTSVGAGTADTAPRPGQRSRVLIPVQMLLIPEELTCCSICCREQVGEIL